jgi:type I restriction enzyme, S subunit
VTNPSTSWSPVRFADMVTSAGATRKARGWAADRTGIDRYVGLEHLDSNSPKIRRWGSPETVGENSDLRHFEAGDIILARRGIEQRKVGMAEFRGVASGHALVFRPRPEVVLPEFLPYFLLSDLFMNRALRFSAGSLSKTVNLTALMKQEFALPPLEEQRRLAKLLTTLSDVVCSLESLVSTGDLLARSAVDECVGQFPSRTIGDIATFVTSGSRGWAEHYADSGALFIRVTNLQPDSVRLDLTDRKFVQPPRGTEGTRTLVRAGDVLVAITGEYLGMIALVPNDIGEAYVNQHVAIVRVDPKRADPRFTAFALTSSITQRAVWSKNDGGTKPGMTLNQVRALPVPDTERRLQDAWASRFEEIDRQRENSRARLNAARRLLASALNGGLS